MLSKTKRILIMIDWYEPAYKAGGPIRSCSNFARHMKEGYEIFVFTSDRDLGDTSPMKEIETDKWISKSDGVQLFYGSPSSLNWKYIKEQISQINPDYIYLNSMYSKYFSVYPLLINHFGKMPGSVVLSPRGMLKESALNFKRRKKMIFLRVFNMLQLQKHVRFHATDMIEVNDIKRHFGKGAKVTHIPNFPGFQKPFGQPIEKKAGVLRMVFVGRVHPIKNLHFLLECLQQIKAKVHLTVVAAVDDAVYWRSCQKKIELLPENITVQIINNVPHHQLEDIITTNHIFSLPTQGENFGHAIFESIAVGRPVLISDQTPWRHLEVAGIGWDLPLNQPQLFIEAIEKACAWDQEQFNSACFNTWNFASNYLGQLQLKNDYNTLFS